MNGTPTSGGGGGCSHPAPGAPAGAQRTHAAGVFAGGTFNAFNLETNDNSHQRRRRAEQLLPRQAAAPRHLGIGWHHQLDEGAAGRRQRASTSAIAPTLAGTPAYIPHRRSPEHRLLDRPGAGQRDRRPARGADADARRRVLVTGLPADPGFIERLVLDSYQARGDADLPVNALGHHVLKAGVDGNIGYYEHTKAYTGRRAYTDVPGNRRPGRPRHAPYAVFEFPRFGYLSGPDQPDVPGSATPSPSRRSSAASSRTAGASWTRSP